jgi:hypothetical protein
VQLAHRYPASPWSALAAVNFTSFFTDIFSGSYARMYLWTATVGTEYALGDFADSWNAFGRAGINASLIDGRLHYNSLFFGVFDTFTNTALRFGFEGEIGGRYNLQSFPLTLETSVGYTNANLIGKSFEQPATRPPYTIDSTDLNDGANPNNPDQGAKTIDFVSLRLGIRVRL